MELLELLETRIDTLLTEVERLRKENSDLQEELLQCMQNLEEANQSIVVLKKEQENATIVRNKLEVLMQRIENVLTK